MTFTPVEKNTCAPVTQAGIRTCEKFSGDFGANEKCTFICASECAIYEGGQQMGGGEDNAHCVLLEG